MSRLRLVAALSFVAAFASSFRCGVDDPDIGPLLRSVTPEVVPQAYETPESVARAAAHAAAVLAAGAGADAGAGAGGAPPAAAASYAEAYHAPPALDAPAARRLQSQTYADGAAFVPISVADATNDTAPLRIAIVWDVVTSGDAAFVDTTGLGAPRQCSAVGQTIAVKSASSDSGWRLFPGGCTAAHIVTGSVGAARLAAMQARTAAAAAYWAATLRVKPVRDAGGVRLSTSASNGVTTDFGLAAGRSFPNADLVLVMTARPSPDSPIAGFAVCYQRDQRGRCTIGNFNWVPEILNVAQTSSPDVVESELHTALHEIVHVLGGMAPGADASSSVFLSNTTGAPLGGSAVFVVEPDPAYAAAVSTAIAAGGAVRTQKTRTLIVTPKVAAVARRWLGCPSLAGFPLEDVPLGKGSHWEARVAGPELMSYGAGSGQVYVSDLTLAFLEDTGQYVANYAMAGQIVPPAVDEAADFLAGSVAPDAGYTPPPALAPGALRWGQGEGCAFVNAPLAGWNPRYLCAKVQSYGCTADNRMAAVCMVSTWSDVPSAPTCGGYAQANAPGCAGAACSVAGGPVCTSENDAAPAGGIPSYMRVFTDAAAAAATGRSTATGATTGGYNDAMDYAPVQVGYWNCQYPRPSDNSTTGAASEYGALAAATAFFGLAADLSAFGGQARCASCRCMVSSLMELTHVTTLSPAFPQYGLCYRTNCYRPDYLQVGIKSPLGGAANWYACPAGGGKLYVPGFAGALHCPVAADFCAHENVTGVQFPEANVALEWAFWGTLLGGVALLLLASIIPACRHRLVNAGKSCCGARVFEPAGARRKRLGLAPLPGDDVGDDEIYDDDGVKPLPVLASRALLVLNGLTLPAGLAILGVSVWAIVAAKTYSFLLSSVALGALVAVAGAYGIGAARARALHGPSCCALVYFFLTLTLAALLVFAVAYTFAFSTFASVADKYYAVIKDALPASVVPANATRAQAVAAVAAYLNTNASAAAGLGAGVALLFAVALGAAGHIISLRVLNGMVIVFVNYLMLAFGALMVAVGGFVVAKAGVVGDATVVVALTLGGGLVFLVVAVVGLVAAFRRSARGTIAYGALTAALVALAFGCTYACMKRADDVVAYVAGLDDKALGSFASSLGLPVTKTTIVEALQANLRQIGLAFGVLAALLTILFANVVLFFVGIKMWKAEVGQDVWGRELDAAAKGDAKAKAAAFKRVMSGRFVREPVVLGGGSGGGGGGARPTIKKGLVVRATADGYGAGADAAAAGAARVVAVSAAAAAAGDVRVVIGDNSAAPRGAVPKPQGAKPPAGPRVLG